jgi:glycerol-3-phosphate cytidylyltransferase-like family protein
MNDLQNAISKLSDKQRNLVFSEGQRFANLEIIYPQTENVIPYNKAFITFHSITEYNKDGAVIDNDVEGARTLQKMINKINANVQKTFKIEDKFQPKLIKVRHFDEKKDKFIKQLNKLKNKFNLKASDTLGDYHYA